MGSWGNRTRAASVWGVCLLGLLASAPARAEAGLSALAFWPAAPMVIATTLVGSGLAGLVVRSAPRVGVELTPETRRLPRVRLVHTDPQPALLVTPPALAARFVMPTRLPEPPGFHFDHGPRAVVLRPDLRLTNDRRGAFVSLRGSF
ncbi:MAG: hypothetical protein QM778_20055 [Myxococcales bacterium]